MKRVSFPRSGGKKGWHDAYRQAEPGQRLVMNIATDLAYRLERSSCFKDGYVLRDMQITVFRIFGRIAKGPYAVELLCACARLLIDHGWRYADRLRQVFWGISEFRNLRVQLRSA